jgi:5,10-methylenetetrahydromethanopterin reductase
MQPGLLLAGRYPPARMIEIVRAAEDSDFGHIWLADERFYREVYEILTLLAVNTARVHLGTCVTDPYSRHPALTAVAIATLDEISRGRAVLGIGAGLSGFAEMSVDRCRPAVAIREAIELIRQLWKGGKVDYHGETVSFHDGHLDFQPPRPDVPVYVAGNGPLVQKLAGSVADGAIMEACGSVRETDVFIRRVREAAHAAGRNPQAVKCIARLNFCVAENGKTARDALRSRVGRNLVGGFMGFSTVADQGLSLPPAALAMVANVPYSAGLAPYEAIVPYVTDQMVDAIALGGTADEIVRHIVELRRSGIDGLIVSPSPVPGDTMEGNIRIFGETIWPAVERELAR